YRRALGGDVVAVERRAGGRAYAPGHHEVLHAEGHAVQRPEPGAPLADGALGRLRLAARLVGVDEHERVEARVDLVDAREQRVHDHHGGALEATGHRRLTGCVTAG